MWKWILALLAALSVAGVAVVYLRRDAGNGAEKYRTEAVERGDVAMTVTATGTISAVMTVQVGSQVSGIISRLHADFNSPVRRGQLLAELDPTPFEARSAQRQADLRQAQVQLRRSKVDFDRQERLQRDDLAPRADYDAAQANYEAAQAQVDQAVAGLEQAETDLRYTKILSPIDGVVVARQYDVGQTVAASFQAPTLFTIAQDLKKMQVQADVDQSDIGRIQVGQPARFTVDAYPDEEFRGAIAQIRLNATVNQNVITYPVILSVPNPDEKLRPQMTANVVIEVAVVKDVIRVPNAALRFRPTQGAGASQAGGRDGGREPGRESRASGGSAVAGTEERAARMGEKGRGLAAMAGQFESATRGRPTQGGRAQGVYVLDDAAAPKRMAIRVGISDGKFTEVLESELKPGDKVIVGQATARSEGTARPPGPGGGRMF